MTRERGGGLPLRRAAGLLGAALLLGGTAPSPELVLRPAEGSAVTKRLVEDTSWSLLDMIQAVEGREITSEVPEVTGRLRRSVEASDVYGAAEGGRLLGVERVLDGAGLDVELHFVVEGFAEDYAYDLESPLVDVPLALAWDADEGEYDVEAEGAGRELVDGLEPRLDLAGLLPAEEVEEGGSWSVAPEALAAALAAGGDLAFARSSAPEGDYRYVEPEDVLGASLTTVAASAAAAEDVDGDVVATWAETLEEDGARLALVRLELELELEADLSERWVRLLEACDRADAREEPELLATCTVEGEAEFLWDLAAGRFRDLSLEAGFETVLRMGWVMQAGGDELDLEVAFDLEGTTVVTASNEAR